MRDQNPDQNAGGGAAVSPSQVLSAGLASAGAALVTSKFGVAGTLLGAALTTMIITGGSAILKAYLESVTGHVRKVPAKLKSRGERKTARFSEPATIPDRPDLRDNLVGRLRAALDWFSRLPQAARRPILIKGAIAALIAFVICMGAVFAVERGIGNSLSCGFWGNCPVGAAPGIHPFGVSGSGAGSSLSGGGAQTAGGTAVPGNAVPGNAVPGTSDSGGGLFQKVPGVGDRAPAGGSSASPAPSDSGASPAPSDSEASPTPSDSSASPEPGGGQPEEPAPSDSSASPAAQEAPAGGAADPASASPEPAQ